MAWHGTAQHSMACGIAANPGTSLLACLPLVPSAFGPRAHSWSPSPSQLRTPAPFLAWQPAV